jgi:hypothetical protein
MRYRRAIAIHMIALIAAWLPFSFRLVAQDVVSAPIQPKDAPTVNSPGPKDEYAALLARVQQGDMTVDFRAFRIAGALMVGPHPSAVEASARAAFNRLLTAGDYAAALDSANQSLNQNYASLVSHFNAMVACRRLNKTSEVVLHGRLTNALLDSIGQSGDGKSPETAWFVVSGQEEYLFLQVVVGLRAKSQALMRHDGHFYDRLEVVDPKTNESRYVWFNTDLDMGLYKPTSPGAGTSQAAAPSEKVHSSPLALSQDVILAQATTVGPGHFHLAAKANTGTHYNVDGTYEVQQDKIIVKIESGFATLPDSLPGDETRQLRNLQLGVCYQSSLNGSWNIWPRGPGASMVPLNNVTLRPGESYQFSPMSVSLALPPDPLPSMNWLCSELWETRGRYPAQDADKRPLAGGQASQANGGAESADSVHPLMDELEGSTIGAPHGIRWVAAIGGHGAGFSAKKSSRIEYPGMVPPEGTLELWIKVDSGYQYSNFNFSATPDNALIFSTDARGGDVTWPGTTRLDVARSGDVSLFIATSKYNRPAAVPTEAHGTKFRFGEWHAIGISYGGQGQFIMVDGDVVASAPAQTHGLGSAGNHQTPPDIPTIGETVSHYWRLHQYEGGFEGVVARFRVSPKQQDWDLARSIDK